MPNHGYDAPAPVLLARHRRSGGAHVGYRRVTGVHRAEGLAGPTRRYLFTVALLAGTSSLPILATIGSGSATVSDGMRPADATPFIAPPAGGPPVVVPLFPTVPPGVEPGPAGTGDRIRRTGWRPLLNPPGAVPDRSAASGTEPGRWTTPAGWPGPNEPDTPPTIPAPPTGPVAPPSPSPADPSPSPSPSTGPTEGPSATAAPTRSPAPTGSAEPTPTVAPAPPVPTATAPTPDATASAGPTATPGPTGHPATPAPSPAPVPSTPSGSNPDPEA